MGEDAVLFRFLVVGFVMWGTLSYAFSQEATINLQCVQIEGAPDNIEHACHLMRSALADRFADKTVSIVPTSKDSTIENNPKNLVRFVFSEGQNHILYGRLETAANAANTPAPEWQIKTRIHDTTNMRVGYKGLVRALLTVNALDQF